jgi:hypothetical protein
MWMILVPNDVIYWGKVYIDAHARLGVHNIAFDLKIFILYFVEWTWMYTTKITLGNGAYGYISLVY